jgi:hypothetical protein
MIELQPKGFQIHLWLTEDRSGVDPALKLEFDSLDEAKAELERHRKAGLHKCRVCIEWHRSARNEC